MRLTGRTLDLGLAAMMAALLAASAWLVLVGDRVALPGGGELAGLCWFRGVVGLDCPFCGMTRSFVALAHGELAAALRFHPAGPLVFAAMAVAVVAFVAALVRGTTPVVERRAFRIAVDAVVAVCLVIGVFQMVRS